MPKKQTTGKYFSYFISFFQWFVVAIVIGLVCGLVGSGFHLAVNAVTSIRAQHRWLIYLLPAAGLLITALYRLTKTEGRGTNDVILSIREDRPLPVLLVPAIFISTVLTHLTGGSAGREGAALQIGGGIGCYIGRLFRSDDKRSRTMTLCGMSAVFSALFGTPLTAVLFALEVASVGAVQYYAFVPCLTASLTAYFISELFGLMPERYLFAVQDTHPVTMLRVAGLAVCIALCGILFCEAMHLTEKAAHKIKNAYLRAFIGGCLVLGFTLLLGSDTYNGAGSGVILAAIEQGSAPAFGFLFKLLFTAVTLGFGFKGGEIVPIFFAGACLGCAVGPLFSLPAGFAAALGMVGLFCSAVNCPVASIILSVELFGENGLLYFALVAGICYVLSGYFGIYTSQHIVFSKTDPEYIDRLTRK